jgi:ABC-type antimicrobial peptide transport system permease subunit
MGRRKDRARTLGLWIAANELPPTGGHPFYQRLNQVLDAHSFDDFVEAQSYSVNRRRREIGIPMALGAQAGEVRRLVMVEGLTLTTIGLGIGIIAALGATRFVESFLYGVAPTDAMAFIFGAHRHAVLSMILSDALKLVALGIGVGVPIAVAGGYSLRAFLFGVAPVDPAALAAACAVLALAALLAAYVPARRAAAVDPLVALRWE